MKVLLSLLVTYHQFRGYRDTPVGHQEVKGALERELNGFVNRGGLTAETGMLVKDYTSNVRVFTEQPISLHRFYFDAIVRSQKTRERYGQAMFNHLLSVRPELAEQVRGTDMDPFHISQLADPRWDKFVSYIEEKWYQ